MEILSQQPDFWQDQEEAKKISRELADLKEEVEKFSSFKKKMKDLQDLISLDCSDEKLTEDVDREAEKLRDEVEQYEILVFLNGKYDKGGAILQIFAGAGGQDAQDWAAMLLRMYQRCCESRGWSAKILHQSFGEAGGPEGRIGIKEASLEIKGAYAYGLLKKENGVHRLVRLSPFSAKQLRHTSFSRVDILPIIAEPELEDIKIKPEELQVDTFRASGPGGQYVNKRETAVRITHLPSGISTASQSERQQGLNRKKAMEVLLGKLHQLKERQREQELAKVKGSPVSAEWGSQIRSYVLHPYRLVKDLRTDVEVSNVEAVLDGELDKFIEAELKMKTEK